MPNSGPQTKYISRGPHGFREEDHSFEDPQHVWLRNKKNKFQLHTSIWILEI